MPGKYLLDTNVVTAVFKQEPVCVERVGDAEAVFLSVTVLGELYFGAMHSRRQAENLERIGRFLSDYACSVLACGDATALAYARIKESQARRGRPIPDNDLWIAAAAAEHDLELATRDKHFADMEIARVAMW